MCMTGSYGASCDAQFHPVVAALAGYTKSLLQDADFSALIRICGCHDDSILDISAIQGGWMILGLQPRPLERIVVPRLACEQSKSLVQ